MAATKRTRAFERLAYLLLLGSPFMLPAEADAHAKGLWMPCGHGAQLHQELRQE